ncbi:MAG: hypothetical protein A2Z20_09815 [Bdellovibrionales bacterium RBG_16_40_8]|nr:MAG: hypothetical protein A2Z20_09815 [Bdellovibrionales bacterium RBG_16_40_8]
MKTLIIIATALACNFAWAHGDHAKPVVKCLAACTQTEIETAIPLAIDALIAGGMVTPEWKTAKVEKTESKQFKKGPEWVTTLVDAKQKDTAKQRLYIFITTKGYLNGANFTGN